LTWNHEGTKAQRHEVMFLQLPPKLELLASEIVDAALSVHTELGPGLLESIYEESLCRELKMRGIAYARQVPVPVIYKGERLSECLRLDILVDDEIIIELKAQENAHPVWEAQLLSYLKLTEKRLGFILNFNVPIMKKGIRRFIM
jgi:GxxExxY protein